MGRRGIRGIKARVGRECCISRLRTSVLIEIGRSTHCEVKLIRPQQFSSFWIGRLFAPKFPALS